MGEIVCISTENPFSQNGHADRLEVLRVGKQIVEIMRKRKYSCCIAVTGFSEDFLQKSGLYVPELVGAITQECFRSRVSCEVAIPSEEKSIELEHSIFGIPSFGRFYRLRIFSDKISADGDRGSSVVMIHIASDSYVWKVAENLWKKVTLSILALRRVAQL